MWRENSPNSLSNEENSRVGLEKEKHHDFLSLFRSGLRTVQAVLLSASIKDG